MSDELSAARLTGTFDDLLGVHFESVGAERVEAWLEAREELRGDDGRLHIGVLASVAEATASIGTFAGAAAENRLIAGMSNETAALAPVTGGRVDVVAERIAAGEDLWTWRIEARDAAAELCASATVQVAVREIG